MDCKDLSGKRKDYHSRRDGFVFWKISGTAADLPFDLPMDEICRKDEDRSLIIHFLVCDGIAEIVSDGERFIVGTNGFANLIGRLSFSICSISVNAKAYLLVYTTEFVRKVMGHQLPIPFSYTMKIRKKPVTTLYPPVCRLFAERMEGIKGVCDDESHIFHEEMLRSANWMLMLDIADRHAKEKGRTSPDMSSDRKKDLFIRFIDEVTRNAAKEHNVGFYASRMCVSPQYLNKIVRSNSDRTAYGWICFTLVGEIKKLLERSDETIQQIADSLNFTDSTSLGKFFKRETGMSLSRYRKLHCIQDIGILSPKAEDADV
ncbi:MAG: helix-turn-helix domain-containing protein [Candidatus Cryptobacteroides sp.]